MPHTHRPFAWARASPLPHSSLLPSLLRLPPRLPLLLLLLLPRAGVHSGDATLVIPAQKLYVETLRRIKKAAALIAAELHITGAFNIQFLSRSNDIMVIECNLRASRSMPFVSKALNVNFVALATRAMLGLPVRATEIKLLDIVRTRDATCLAPTPASPTSPPHPSPLSPHPAPQDYVCVKVPMFSFSRLAGADPVLRVEMSSTGEVAAFGTSVYDAYLTALVAANFRVPLPGAGVVISTGPIQAKVDVLPAARALQGMGYRIFATPTTHAFLQGQGTHGSGVTRSGRSTFSCLTSVSVTLSLRSLRVIPQASRRRCSPSPPRRRRPRPPPASRRRRTSPPPPSLRARRRQRLPVGLPPWT